MFEKIPKDSITKRWTISRQPNINLNDNPQVLEQHVINSRYVHLMSFLIPLCHIASMKHVYYKDTLDSIEKLWLKYKHVEIKGIQGNSELNFIESKDPTIVSTKGRCKKRTSQACGTER